MTLYMGPDLIKKFFQFKAFSTVLILVAVVISSICLVEFITLLKPNSKTKPSKTINKWQSEKRKEKARCNNLKGTSSHSKSLVLIGA